MKKRLKKDVIPVTAETIAAKKFTIMLSRSKMKNYMDLDTGEDALLKTFLNALESIKAQQEGVPVNPRQSQANDQALKAAGIALRTYSSSVANLNVSLSNASKSDYNKNVLKGVGELDDAVITNTKSKNKE